MEQACRLGIPAFLLIRLIYDATRPMRTPNNIRRFVDVMKTDTNLHFLSVWLRRLAVVTILGLLFYVGIQIDHKVLKVLTLIVQMVITPVYFTVFETTDEQMIVTFFESRKRENKRKMLLREMNGLIITMALSKPELYFIEDVFNCLQKSERKELANRIILVDKVYYTPIGLVLRLYVDNRYEKTKYLLEMGADPNEPELLGRAVRGPRSLECTIMMLRYGAKVPTGGLRCRIWGMDAQEKDNCLKNMRTVERVSSILVILSASSIRRIGTNSSLKEIPRDILRELFLWI
jgi:hypothetical protein